MFRIRYAKTIATCAALAVATLLVTLVLTHTGRAKPRPAPRATSEVTLPNEVGREGIKPGNYATAINIHNPSLSQTVTLYKGAVVVEPEESLTASTSVFQSYSLLAGQAVEVDCEDIYGLYGFFYPPAVYNSFTEGFVTILSTAPLDVVAVYTAEPPLVASTPSSIPGMALRTLNIAPRTVTLTPAEVTGGYFSTGLPAGRYLEYPAKFLCLQAVPPLP